MQPGSTTPALQACPWLYLHTDADSRASHVTADHRCEIRSDEVPGPGHQLAYCLSTNHVSCPQLLSYEARRHATTEGARPEPVATSAGYEELRKTRADLRASLIGAPRPPNAVQHSRGTLAGRVRWLAAGALGALALVAAFTVYGNNSATSDPDADAAARTSTVATPFPTNTQDAAAAAVQLPSTPDIVNSESLFDRTGATGQGSSPLAGPEQRPNGTAASGVPTASPTAEPTPRPTNEPTPVPPPTTYIVQVGDTLGQIAQSLGIDILTLAQANGMTTETFIYEGDVLQLPVDPDLDAPRSSEDPASPTG
ncbi:MAG: LysM peptidoglycan-binding domain-containing protein [Chloroflexi bacterium]|nr:LysM peptidoglycan-binding domain-containing protein [Chloroflexota bacterium]MDA1146250.1 LysM peptidoglycan-binding domain-containing protein [Chloroflexota bacterium]